MQLSLKPLVLLALPLLPAVVALPTETNVNVTADSIGTNNADCVVNSRNRDVWVENGLSRWRTVFSAEGTDPGLYCDIWRNALGQ
ncbi:hypothetical protein B0T14DRAFT_596966 [Immersiella caudata]|uniref:Uncharacterized protein n=1 Tax=Immersiella caudata TaxID=314043 RepID=A0AA39XDN5_9PEZI|nr:hypothetical protein B0T14DRAFT_596966 [Immersiella caudata]